MRRKITASFMVLLMLLLPVNVAIALDSTVDSTASGSATTSSSGFPEWANSNNFGFSGSTSPNSIIDIYVNGVHYTSTISDDSGNYEFKKVLLSSDGANNIRLIITNTADNSKTQEDFVVNVDNTNPIFSDLSEVPTNYQESSITISGKVSEESEIVVTANGEEIDILSSSGAFSSSVSLDDGNNEITLEATDRAGNSATTSFSINVDTTEPEIIRDNLDDLSPTYSRKVTVRGQVSEPATVMITVDGQGGSLYQCSDGIDNDGDGLIDYPNDPGCTSLKGMIEQDPVGIDKKACNDNIDNDGDGKIDFGDDLGCDSYSDDDETDWDGNSKCNDGVDNDNDGLIDFNPKGGGDLGCVSLNDNDESDNDDVGNVNVVSTDERGFFEKEIDLGHDITTSMTTTNSIKVDGKTDSFELNFDGYNKEHKVKITAVDGVGNLDTKEGTVTYSSCSSGDGDFLIFQKETFPGSLIPDHIFQGIAQVNFGIELNYVTGTDIPEDIQLSIGERELSNEDKYRNKTDDEHWDLDIFDSNNCVANSDGSGLNWYVTCRLKQFPPGAYRNITKAYEDFEAQEVVRLPINLDVRYTTQETSWNGTVAEVPKIQRVCYDMEFLLDKRIDPDKIPRDLLENSVDLLEDVIDAIDDILPWIQRARWATFAACALTFAWEWIGSARENWNCLVVNKDDVSTMKTMVRASSEKGHRINDDLSEIKNYKNLPDGNAKKTQYETCATSIAKTRSNSIARSWVCDRIFCPSVPSQQKYMLDADDESPCSQETDGKYRENSYINGPEPPNELNGCDIDYEDTWNSGCVVLDPLKESRELQGNNVSRNTFGKVVNKINGLSLCEFFENGETKDGRTYYSSGGHSVIADSDTGGNRYQLAQPIEAGTLDEDSKATSSGEYHTPVSIEYNYGDDNSIPEAFSSDPKETYVGSNGDCVFVRPNLEQDYSPGKTDLYTYRSSLGKSDDDDVYEPISLTPVSEDDVKNLNTAYGYEEGAAKDSYYVDRNGEIYYPEADNPQKMTKAPYYYVTEQSEGGKSQFSAKLFDPETKTKPDKCYKNDLIRENSAKEYLIDPADGFLNSVQCVCLPAIEGYLTSIKNILTAIKNCFESILISNEFDTGVCKAILTQYLCDFVFDLLFCTVKSFSFSGQAGDENQATPTQRFFTSLSKAGEDIKERSMSRYGKASSFRAIFNERQLIHAICLAAFGYDWQPDLDAAMSVQGGGFSINSTGMVSPATRRFMSYDPNNQGITTHVYHVGYFLTAGEDVNWKLDLICSSTYNCDPKEGFINGRCDCAGGTSGTTASQDGTNAVQAGVGKTLTIDGGFLTAGDSVGSGGNNPYATNQQGDIYKSITEPIRYDRARLSWTPRNDETGKPGSVEIPIRQEGLAAPLDCKFSAALLEYRCSYTNSGDGFVFIDSVKEFRRQSAQDEDPGEEPFGQNEAIEYEIGYKYDPGTNEEETPRYLRITIEDEKGRIISAGQMHTKDYEIKPGANFIKLPYDPLTPKELVGGAESTVTSSTTTGRGISGDGYSDGKITSNDIIELSPQGSNENEYLFFFWTKNKDEVHQTSFLESEIREDGKVDYKSAIGDYITSNRVGNILTVKSDKISFEDNVLTIEPCDAENYCVAYYLLKPSKGGTSETLDRRCEEQKTDNLKWSATFEFMDGRLVDGKAQYTTRKSATPVSTLRPTEKTVDLTIACEDYDNDDDSDDEDSDELDSCEYDVELTEPCMCGDDKLSDNEIDDGYVYCLPVDWIGEDSSTADSGKELNKTLKTCPLNGEKEEDKQKVFYSWNNDGECEYIYYKHTYDKNNVFFGSVEPYTDAYIKVDEGGEQVYLIKTGELSHNMFVIWGNSFTKEERDAAKKTVYCDSGEYFNLNIEQCR